MTRVSKSVLFEILDNFQLILCMQPFAAGRLRGGGRLKQRWIVARIRPCQQKVLEDLAALLPRALCTR